jgi:hypothetical protein
VRGVYSVESGTGRVKGHDEQRPPGFRECEHGEDETVVRHLELGGDWKRVYWPVY